MKLKIIKLFKQINIYVHTLDSNILKYKLKKWIYEASILSIQTLLSQRYNEVLIGLKGSKSILTFFSFPSSVTIVPQ